jgi:hypothetical protein
MHTSLFVKPLKLGSRIATLVFSHCLASAACCCAGNACGDGKPSDATGFMSWDDPSPHAANQAKDGIYGVLTHAAGYLN